jgi:hypothetical protein
MKNKHILAVALLAPLALGAGPCADDSLTVGEALQALEEVSLSSQAVNLTSSSVEISTNFTIGQAVEEAAAELRDFIESQLPCAEISLQGATLSIEYGVYAGNCTYKGQSYEGAHEITVSSAQAGSLVVDHEWTGFSNGKVRVDGTAQVTWSSIDSSRNVVHELTWTREMDDFQVVGGGDRTQTLMDGGLVEGIEINGARDWTSERGDWDLDVDGVQVRWADPVPQAGKYTLETPFDGKTVELVFERLDDDTIRVTVSSGQKGFDFDVTKTGGITES